MELKYNCGSITRRNLLVTSHDEKKVQFEQEESFMFLYVMIDNKCLEEKEMRMDKANYCTGIISRVSRKREIS